MSHTASTSTAATAGTRTETRRGGEEGVVVTEDGRVLNDPTHADLPDHGNTPGGWIMAGLAVLGVAAGCLGLLMDLDILVWIGAIMVVVGGVVGILSAKAQSARPASARHGH